MSFARICQRYYYQHRCRGTLISIIIGLSVGLCLSLVVSSLFDGNCFDSKSDYYSGGRSLQQSELSASILDFENADYEPQLHLESKPRSVDTSDKKTTSKLPFRSRFYSTELGIKEKLLVAVLADRENSLQFLGEAINTTIQHHVNKLLFFARQTDNFESSNNVVITLPDGPDILYPFQALSHINEHHGDDYDYIFIVPGNAYIRGRYLHKLVSSISVSQNVYMGIPLEDTAIKESPALYCDFRGGIILSQSVLKAVINNLDWCRRNSFSDDPSDNIGRCVLHSIGIPCSKIIQGNLFSSVEIEKTFYFDSDIDSYGHESNFLNAVTIQPVVSKETIFKLHLFYSQLELRENQKQLLELRSAVEKTNEFIPQELQSSVWPLGWSNSGSPPILPDRHSIISWDYLTLDLIYKEGEQGGIRNLTSFEREDLLEVLNNGVWRLQRAEPDLKFLKLLNGYRRFDPNRGLEYQLDITLLNGRTNLQFNRRVEGIRLLGNVELIPVPYVTENTQLVMLLPVTANAQSDVIRFLKEFAEVCLENQDNAILVLVFLRNPDENESHFGELKNLIATYNHKYQTEGAKLSSMSIKMSSDQQPTAFAVLDMVSKKFSMDTLFLLCQPGMEIRSDYLNRARMNSISGWQVFFPIPFTQYHPGIVYRDLEEPTQLEIGKNYGHFDQHDFGYFSFYNSDYQTARKTIEKEVPIARSDRDTKDVRHRGRTGYDIYEMFLRWAEVHVMRAVEPSLRIHYGERRCDVSLRGETLVHCESARTKQLASPSILATLILQHQSAITNSQRLLIL